MSSQAAPAIELATSTTEIQQCLPVMLQLRPHLHPDSFVERVQTQMTTGYQLAYLQDINVIAVAGFNITSNLACLLSINSIYDTK